MSESKTPGKIITFYSYKGGTGRSMTLANVAWILASNAKRVLVIDWDLEAPGLHRYFSPFLVDRNLASSDGVIDFVTDYRDEAIRPPEKGQTLSEDWYLPYTDITQYATSLKWQFPEKDGKKGRLDFVPAGRQVPSYATQVNLFNWQLFYEKLGGAAFLETAKKKMRETYDYVLIDSRTGVSDTSGICTLQMPDILVVCFTLNNQGIEGALGIGKSVREQRERQDIRIFPVPMRIENAEAERRGARLDYVKKKFTGFPEHLSASEIDTYWEEVGVYYIPFYAFQEMLACFGDLPRGTISVLKSAERLTAYLTDNEVTQLNISSEEVRKNEILLEYSQQDESEPDAEYLQSQAAEFLFANLTIQDQLFFKRALTRMVRIPQPGEGSPYTRARLSLNTLDNQTVQIIRVMKNAQLLQSEVDADKEYVEIANPALISGWKRLRDWLEEDKEFLLWRQSMQEQVARWEPDSGDGPLLQGLSLVEATAWLSRRGEDFNFVEQRFIRDSLEKRQRELSRIAESVFAGLSTVEQQMARQVFTRLVAVARPVEDHDERSLKRSSAREDTRSPISLNDFAPLARQVVHTLSLSQLVATEVDKETGEVIVQVVDDALIRGWERLRGWLEEDREFLLWRQELKPLIAEWKKNRSDESSLLKGEALVQAADCYTKRKDDLNLAEQEFIKASLEADEREQAKAAERVFARLTTQEQKAARQMLTRMVGIEESSADAKYTRARLRTDQLEPGWTEVLPALLEAKLVSRVEESRGEESRADGAAVQLASDALLRRWQRLQDWLRESATEESAPKESALEERVVEQRADEEKVVEQRADVSSAPKPVVATKSVRAESPTPIRRISIILLSFIILAIPAYFIAQRFSDGSIVIPPANNNTEAKNTTNNNQANTNAAVVPPPQLTPDPNAARPEIWIYYTDSRSQGKVNELTSVLKQYEYNVAGSDFRDASPKAYVRFFHKEDRTNAERVSQIINNSFKDFFGREFEAAFSLLVTERLPLGSIRIWLPRLSKSPSGAGGGGIVTANGNFNMPGAGRANVNRPRKGKRP